MIYFSLELAKIYEQERIEEAEHYRQLKQIWAGEPVLPDHLLAKMAKLSLCLGRTLKKQFKQTMAVLTKVEMRFEGWFRNRLIH